MPKFLCLQRSLQSSTPEDQRPSPAEMQAMFAKFGEWQEQFKDQVPDMGGRLGAGTVVTHGDVDGPYVEVKELVGGYMIVEADDLDGAIAIAKACPGVVRPGSGVEVIEIHGP